MPKQVDAGAQRRKITTAAIAVIGTEGLEGARLRDVARAADVTTGVVMHYFDDKDAVLEAALEEIVERTLQRMATPSTTTPGDVPTFVQRTCRYLPLDAAGREAAPSRRRDLLRRARAYVEASLRDFQHFQGRAAAEEARAQRLIEIIERELGE